MEGDRGEHGEASRGRAPPQAAHERLPAPTLVQPAERTAGDRACTTTRGTLRAQGCARVAAADGALAAGADRHAGLRAAGHRARRWRRRRSPGRPTPLRPALARLCKRQAVVPFLCRPCLTPADRSPCAPVVAQRRRLGARGGGRRIEADTLVCAVAERLVRRVAAAAERDTWTIAFVFSPLDIDHREWTFNQVRPVRPHDDARLVWHRSPPPCPYMRWRRRTAGAPTLPQHNTWAGVRRWLPERRSASCHARCVAQVRGARSNPRASLCADLRCSSPFGACSGGSPCIESCRGKRGVAAIAPPAVHAGGPIESHE